MAAWPAAGILSPCHLRKELLSWLGPTLQAGFYRPGQSTEWIVLGLWTEIFLTGQPSEQGREGRNETSREQHWLSQGSHSQDGKSSKEPGNWLGKGSLAEHTQPGTTGTGGQSLTQGSP